MGQNGENGDAIVDLLEDSKKDQISSQAGIIIRGEIIDSKLMGPLKGKALIDLSDAMINGETYVNIITPTHPEGEIRGQIEVNEKSKGS